MRDIPHDVDDERIHAQDDARSIGELHVAVQRTPRTPRGRVRSRKFVQAVIFIRARNRELGHQRIGFVAQLGTNADRQRGRRAIFLIRTQ